MVQMDGVGDVACDISTLARGLLQHIEIINQQRTLLPDGASAGIWKDFAQ